MGQFLLWGMMGSRSKEFVLFEPWARTSSRTKWLIALVVALTCALVVNYHYSSSGEEQVDSYAANGDVVANGGYLLEKERPMVQAYVDELSRMIGGATADGESMHRALNKLVLKRGGKNAINAILGTGHPGWTQDFGSLAAQGRQVFINCGSMGIDDIAALKARKCSDYTFDEAYLVLHASKFDSVKVEIVDWLLSEKTIGVLPHLLIELRETPQFVNGGTDGAIARGRYFDKLIEAVGCLSTVDISGYKRVSNDDSRVSGLEAIVAELELFIDS